MLVEESGVGGDGAVQGDVAGERRWCCWGRRRELSAG